MRRWVGGWVGGWREKATEGWKAKATVVLYQWSLGSPLCLLLPSKNMKRASSLLENRARIEKKREKYKRTEKFGIRWWTCLGFWVLFWAFIKSQILFWMTRFQASGSSSGLISISFLFIRCQELWGWSSNFLRWEKMVNDSNQPSFREYIFIQRNTRSRKISVYNFQENKHVLVRTCCVWW